DIPRGVPVETSYPAWIMALDENGGELVAAKTNLDLIPERRIHIRAKKDQIVRTRTLLFVPLEVTNDGLANQSVGLVIEGKRRYWAHLWHKRLALRPGMSFTVTLTVRIPVEAQHGQDADIIVQATSLKDGSARDFVQIGVAPPYAIRTNVSTDG